MHQLKDDTITAIATPIGEGGIGVIRISGPQTIDIAQQIFSGRISIAEQRSHTAQYGHIHTPNNASQVIDDVLLLVLKNPKSYTGEDTVEINCHGGRLILQKIIDVCLMAGARMAEPGEFTRRAFLNGRLDLIQAENVIDIIQAKSDQSLKIARLHLEGKLSARIKELRDGMTDIVSHMEAHLDFPDDDIDPETQSQIQTRVQKIMDSIQDLIEHSNTGKVIHHGLTVALTGRPNVGKSSLLNILIDEDRVIVSDTPGTTRDTVEVNMEVAGYHIKLVDTAGFRESKDDLENKSLQRAAKIIDAAHIVLFIVDASEEPDAAEIERLNSLAHKSLILVANKEDCMPVNSRQSFQSLAGQRRYLFTSAITGQGIVELRESIVADIQKGQAERSEEILVHSVRQLNLLRQANQHLDSALKAFDSKLSLEFPSSDIRLAIDALGEMVGAIVTDDILDKIFSRFCIGK